ncbi:DUF3237 domain-containing protein [Novosphingobium umbonatum]|uniref:UPF0311 protein EOE18_06585 n=1 Tax=Novosphingobium umbonatum TaxID=1908524 RepID=A0A3S2Y826_9SPHN|nr:DUF3237 domain-containing protein [Novosphingobium umbonatum]RVU05656.1 DUF3237 domain-containing protein [Novosphingobium umbonatum]
MTPALEPVCTLTIALTKPHEMGACGTGTRRIIPIKGGTVDGPRIKGRILDVGADWQTVLADGVAQLDARYAIETEDGAVIEVLSQGMRHMAPEVAARAAAGEDIPFTDYYMRTFVRLETGHASYDWVNRALFLAAGGKRGAVVELDIFQIG